MVDKPEPAGLLFAIDRFVVIDFHHGNFVLGPGPAPAFAPADELAFILTDFLPGTKGHLQRQTSLQLPKPEVPAVSLVTVIFKDDHGIVSCVFETEKHGFT